MCNIVNKLKKRNVTVTSKSFISQSVISQTANEIKIIIEENSNIVISVQNRSKVRTLINKMYGKISTIASTSSASIQTRSRKKQRKRR